MRVDERKMWLDPVARTHRPHADVRHVLRQTLDTGHVARWKKNRLIHTETTVQVGKIYDGTVTSVKDFGAFVEILPGRDGLCHISELSNEYVGSVWDICSVGDPMKVKVLSVDEQDRVKLSRKVAMQELGEADPKPVESAK